MLIMTRDLHYHSDYNDLSSSKTELAKDDASTWMDLVHQNTGTGENVWILMI